jgi:hypothetical protein
MEIRTASASKNPARRLRLDCVGQLEQLGYLGVRPRADSF